MKDRKAVDPIYYDFIFLMEEVRTELSGFVKTRDEGGQHISLTKLVESLNGVLPEKTRAAISLRNKLVEKNMGLVHKVARMQEQRSLDIDDLVQAGAIGCIRAIENYDPDRAAFSTYAMNWIRYYIQMAIQKAGVADRKKGTAPRRVHVSTSELCNSEAQGVNKRTRAGLKGSQLHISGNSETVGDTLRSDDIPADEQLMEHQGLSRLEQAIASLPVLEADVIRAKFYEKEPSDAIERRVIAGREAMRGKKIKALEKLRVALREEED